MTPKPYSIYIYLTIFHYLFLEFKIWENMTRPSDTMSRKENNNCKNISTKKKVWTQLKSGLYGWRVIKKGGRRSKGDNILKSGDGRVPPSAQAIFLEVPAGFGKIITVGSNKLMPGRMNKRKLNFGGNNIQKGAISELGGEVSDPDLKTMRLDLEELPM